MKSLTNEELEYQYREAVGIARYHHNTDDLDSWNRERAEREANDKRLEQLGDEYKRRGITPPRIP
jgi:hypothetical protein